MVPWLFLVTLAAPAEDPANALLEAARTAETAGDRALRDQYLRGWASLTPGAPPPAGLEAPAAVALAFIQARGGLDVYTSRLPDRLRVGIHDPAALVDRVDTYVEVDGALLRLTRLEGEAPDRRDYRRPAADQTGPLVIELYSTQLGRELLLRRAILAPSQPNLPGPPDPQRAAQVIDPQAIPPSVGPPEEAPTLVSWWWIAAGVVAVGLSGAAVWQETR